jgi:type I site-specific restriction endonuclease
VVRAELELIIEIQTDEFWQDVTTTMLEDVRKRLREFGEVHRKDEAPKDLYRLRRLDGRGAGDLFARIRRRAQSRALPREDRTVSESATRMTL